MILHTRSDFGMIILAVRTTRYLLMFELIAIGAISQPDRQPEGIKDPRDGQEGTASLVARIKIGFSCVIL